MTSSTDVMPATPAMEMSTWAQPSPTLEKALDTPDPTLISW
jgi:hypothetical protein